MILHMSSAVHSASLTCPDASTAWMSSGTAPCTLTTTTTGWLLLFWAPSLVMVKPPALHGAARAATHACTSLRCTRARRPPTVRRSGAVYLEPTNATFSSAIFISGLSSTLGATPLHMKARASALSASSCRFTSASDFLSIQVKTLPRCFLAVCGAPEVASASRFCDSVASALAFSSTMASMLALPRAN